MGVSWCWGGASSLQETSLSGMSVLRGGPGRLEVGHADQPNGHCHCLGPLAVLGGRGGGTCQSAAGSEGCEDTQSWSLSGGGGLPQRGCTSISQQEVPSRDEQSQGRGQRGVCSTDSLGAQGWGVGEDGLPQGSRDSPSCSSLSIPSALPPTTHPEFLAQLQLRAMGGGDWRFVPCAWCMAAGRMGALGGPSRVSLLRMASLGLQGHSLQPTELLGRHSNRARKPVSRETQPSASWLLGNAHSSSDHMKVSGCPGARQACSRYTGQASLSPASGRHELRAQ